jgi:Heparinase II/III-like protein
VNYHRLMLQLTIWIQALANLDGANSLPADVKEKIVLAVHWLEQLMLSNDGQVPNMGSNDGANILPLNGVAVSDYRPIIKLARQLFPSRAVKSKVSTETKPQQVVVMKDADQAACMRIARYPGRPAHADQLHLDLWWNNWNIALDAGTYRYNHAPPWENALAGTATHNTITLNGIDQMIRAGRFLWIQKANIHNLDIQRDSTRHIRSVSAMQDGYRRFGADHGRKVITRPGGKPGWLIQDDIVPSDGIPTASKYRIRLVWLLPDWEWEVEERSFRLISPSGIIRLDFAASGIDERTAGLEIFRAGEALTATRASDPTWGWYSPTYGIKEPALAVHFLAEGTLPMQLTTHWRLPK